MNPTARQIDLLRFIAGYLRAHDGVSPTLQECADALGVGKSSVFKCLVRLEERKLIRRPRYHHRWIELLVPVAVPQAPDGAPLYAVLLPGSRCA